MQPVVIVLGAQFIAGIIGFMMSVPSNSSAWAAPGAAIDDPSKGCRIFSRTMLFLMCNMFSVFTLLALLALLMDESDKGMFSGGPAWMIAVALLVAPLPLAWLYFAVLCGVIRGWHRFLKWEPKNQNRRW